LKLEQSASPGVDFRELDKELGEDPNTRRTVTQYVHDAVANYCWRQHLSGATGRFPSVCRLQTRWRIDSSSGTQHCRPSLFAKLDTINSQGGRRNQLDNGEALVAKESKKLSETPALRLFRKHGLVWWNAT
jgi:hypothetical protein